MITLESTAKYTSDVCVVYLFIFVSIKNLVSYFICNFPYNSVGKQMENNYKGPRLLTQNLSSI